MQTVEYRPTTSRLAGWALLWIVVACLTIMALILFLVGKDELDRTAGSSMALIACGLIFAFYGDDEFDMFSPAFFWGMNFAVFYGVAAIMPFVMPPEEAGYQYVFALGRAYYPQAALVTLVCLVFFIAGYRTKSPALWGRRNTWLVGGTGSENSVRLYWAILLAMGLIAFVIQILGGAYLQTTDELQTPLFYSAVGFIQMGLFVAVPLALSRALDPHARPFWRSAAVFSVGGTLVFGLPSGSKTLALLALVFIGFAWNYSRQRFSRRQALLAIACTFAILALLMPFNAIYRVVLAGSSASGQGMADNVSSMKEAMVEFGERGPEEVIDLALDYSSQRLSNIAIVASLLDYQEFHDLELGSTYFRLIYMFIPRFIWPEKPPMTIGREVAYNFGMGSSDSLELGVQMSTSSVGLTFVGEAIYNFSRYAAPLFMFFLGGFYRWLYEALKAHQPSSDALRVSIACFSWYALVFTAHESNLAAVLAGFIKFIIFLWLLRNLLKFRKVSA